MPSRPSRQAEEPNTRDVKKRETASFDGHVLEPCHGTVALQAQKAAQTTFARGH